jgi:hypothetical protein
MPVERSERCDGRVPEAPPVYLIGTDEAVLENDGVSNCGGVQGVLLMLMIAWG